MKTKMLWRGKNRLEIRGGCFDHIPLGMLVLCPPAAAVLSKKLRLALLPEISTPSPVGQVCFCDHSAVITFANLFGFDKYGLGSNLMSNSAGRFG